MSRGVAGWAAAARDLGRIAADADAYIDDPRVQLWHAWWKGRCAYCGRRADSVDHVIPRCQGGSDDAGNLVPACKPCNSSKNGTPLAVFLAGSPRELRRINSYLRIAGIVDGRLYEYSDNRVTTMTREIAELRAALAEAEARTTPPAAPPLRPVVPWRIDPWGVVLSPLILFILIVMYPVKLLSGVYHPFDAWIQWRLSTPSSTGATVRN